LRSNGEDEGKLFLMPASALTSPNFVGAPSSPASRERTIWGAVKLTPIPP